MTYIETVDDIVEEICDAAGFYTDSRCSKRQALGDEDPEFLPEDEHVDHCACRVVVANDWTPRLRAALIREQKLEVAQL